MTIAGSGDRGTITAILIINLAGNFLPIQMIYGGKPDRSLPKNPKGFSLNANPKHYRNKKETQKVINEIISPRVKSVREELKLSSNFPALLVMDVFRGQMTTGMHRKLQQV